MKTNTLRTVVLVTSLLGSQASAGPIGLLDQDGGFVDLLNTSIITGVRVQPLFGGGVVTQGTKVLSPDSALENKSYTAMQVQLGNAEDEHETYVERPGLIGKMFASAYANGAGDLQVGADGFSAAGNALSRFNLTIKNERSRPVRFDFAFDIPAGEVLTMDPARHPARDPRRSHARVHAEIDAILKSPDEEEPGRWVETEHALFDFFVDVQGSCGHGDLSCAGVAVDYSANAQPLLKEHIIEDTSTFGLDIDAYSGLISMPEIPPFGELTIFYDMYALAFGTSEGGARAALGDPLGLISSAGVHLIERTPGPTPTPRGNVPEPGTLLLTGAGLLILVGRQLRRPMPPSARRIT